LLISPIDQPTDLLAQLPSTMTSFSAKGLIPQEVSVTSISSNLMELTTLQVKHMVGYGLLKIITRRLTMGTTVGRVGRGA
jgi:hypothetical protein